MLNQMSAPEAAPLLRFEAVTKRFGSFSAVDALSLDVRRGEFFALLGPSGCGKSTLLRLAAGFEIPDAGTVMLDGEDLAGRPPHIRPVNMMFQSYALFPHMSVEANVAFGLKQERRPKDEIARRVNAMLALVRLEDFAKRKPDGLSGGQRQRVALARALVKEPKVLLLDEPLAALDRKLREETGAELLALQRRLGTTFVIVTHDQDEAMTLADRIAVMAKGQVAQVGTPRQVYERPQNRYVADFLGDVNLFEGRVAARGPQGMFVDTVAGPVHAAGDSPDLPVGAAVWVAVRPEKIRLTETRRRGEDANARRGVIDGAVFRGESLGLRVSINESVVLKVALPNGPGMDARGLAVGNPAWVSWPPEAAIILRD